MQVGRGVKADKAEKVLAQAGILIGDEAPLVYVKCNNFRPLVNHVLITSTRIIGFADSEKRARFTALRDDTTQAQGTAPGLVDTDISGP